jgi:hypothetical protein
MDKHIPDDDDYFTDEEDEEWNAPITAAWGVPSSEQEAEHVEENDGSGDVNGWHQIADPNAKLRADGVGAGNLHRQGKNFKPLDESYIVNQRLGKAVPKKAQAKPISVHTKATKVSIRPLSSTKPHTISDPGAGKKAAKKARQASLAIAAERARAVEMAAARKRPPSKVEDVQVQSTWAAGASLVTTPFWEQSSAMSSVHARQPQQQKQNEVQHRKPPRAPIPQTQKPAPTPTPTPTPAPAPAPPAAHKFGTQIKGLSESMRKLEIARAASGFQSPRTSTKPASTGRVVEVIPKSVPAENKQTAKPAIPSSKPNQALPKPKPNMEPVKPSKPRQPTSFAPAPAPAPAPKPTVGTKENSSAHSKWANPASVPAAVLFTLNIELEKGETMPITIRANDDPRQLAVAFVERFQQRSGDVSSANNDNVVEALTHLIQQQIKIKSGKA